MYVFIHIPKTAGTSLGSLFDYSLERRILWDYDAEYRYADTIQPIFRENMDFISNYFKIIYGHFYNTKYSEILPDATYLTCVRHPVKRIISQYYHVALEGRNWQSEHIREGKMDVISFAKTGNIANAQQLHMAGRELADYGHIFITEHLEKSVKLFEVKNNFKFNTGLPTMNTHAGREIATAEQTKNMSIKKVVKEDEAEIFKLCKDDAEIYREAKDILERERKAFS